MQESNERTKCLTIWLPRDRAVLWGEGSLPNQRDKWYVPVRYHLEPKPGHAEVSVNEGCVEGGWFHPTRHPNLPFLAELLS